MDILEIYWYWILALLISAWFSNLILYIIGDIAENIEKIANNSNAVNNGQLLSDNHENKDNSTSQTKNNRPFPVSSKIVGSTWRCSECGKENPLSKTVCQCGKYK